MYMYTKPCLTNVFTLVGLCTEANILNILDVLQVLNCSKLRMALTGTILSNKSGAILEQILY